MNAKRARKKLTSAKKIDSLEKFAKTSHATEALLAESKQDQKREQKVSSKIQTTTAHQVRGHEYGLYLFSP